MKNTALFVAMTVACISAPAFAQEVAPFTGAHAGIITGYDAVDTNSVIGTPDGVLYGLNAGYDYRSGNLVVGVEGEAADSTANRKFVGGKLSAKRDLYIGGRVGSVIGGGNLLYVKAGYTNARFGATGAGSANGDGVRVGGGIEHDFSRNLLVKAEYRYSNYEAGVERHQVVAGVGVRF